MQFLHGDTVDTRRSIEMLKPGDLVFFGHLNSERRKIITHTGIYIGNSEVINSSGRVQVNSLDSTRTNFSSYLKSTFMGARRIIGAKSGRGIEPVSASTWYFTAD